MSRSVPERDWKLIRSMHEELLEELCARINRQSGAILEDAGGSEVETYRALYRHVLASDEIIAECFDDLRRSKLLLKLRALYRHGLLSPEHIERFSSETRAWLEAGRTLK